MFSLFRNVRGIQEASDTRKLLESQEIQRIPRKVQMGWGGKVELILLAGVLIVSGSFLASVTTKVWRTDVVEPIVIVGVFLLSASILSQEAFHLARDYKLLKTGKCALGQIASQRRMAAAGTDQARSSTNFPSVPENP